MKAKLLNSILLVTTVGPLQAAFWTTFDNGLQNTLSPALYLGGDIIVKNGSTLTITPGIVMPAGANITVVDNSRLIVEGGSFEGAVQFRDNASGVIRGGTFGGVGEYSGMVRLEGTCQLLIEAGEFGGGMFAGAISTSADGASRIQVHGGTFGGEGAFSGQIAVMGNSTIQVGGGVFGGIGAGSGGLQLLDRASAEIRGGRFGGTAEKAGQVWLRDDSVCFIEGGIFAREEKSLAEITMSDSARIVLSGCGFNLPFGNVPLPLADTWVTGAFPSAGQISCPVMLEDPANSLASMELRESRLCSPDVDGDGVLDSEDAVPGSDMRPTVVLDGTYTGVANHLLPDGSTMMDLLSTAQAQARNHGQFVSLVSNLATQLQGTHITAEEKRVLVRCAARSQVGK